MLCGFDHTDSLEVEVWWQCVIAKVVQRAISHVWPILSTELHTRDILDAVRKFTAHLT